jgi:hypothetical protein
MDTASSYAIDEVIEAFKQGRLTEQTLRQALEQAAAPGQHQDLLYLEAASTSLVSEVLGMAMVCNGEIVPGSGWKAQWPYPTVLSALRDGWRIIKFPELTLLLSENRTTGLGCEFILEKWS